MRQKKAEASPKREDFEKEFGKHRIKDEKDGSWTLSLRGDERDSIKKAHQMQEGIRKLDVERGQELHSRAKNEKVVRRDGKVIELAEELVDSAKRNGIRPVGRNGTSVAIRSNLSNSYGKYKQGPEGLWFVWNDGWEPTKLWAPADAGETQRDPDNNVWVLVDGEWSLAEE